MPHNRQRCGIYGGAENLPVKDILSTSTEGVQEIKTKKTSIEIWNARTLHQEGQIVLLLDKMENINTVFAGISETHWFSDVDVAFQQNLYPIIHSGKENDILRQGVALILFFEYANSLVSYEAVLPMMVSSLW